MNEESTPHLRFTAPSATGPREVELRIARVREVSGLINDERYTDMQQLRAITLRPMLLMFVDRLDGEPFLYDRLDSVLADPDLVRAILVRLRTVLDALRERGRIFALCPGCKTWEAEMTFTGYALAIAEPLPSTFDGSLFALVHLADRSMRAAERPPIPRAARIRFELPSATLGTGDKLAAGVLGQVNFQPDEDTPPPSDDDDDDDDEVRDFDELPMTWGSATWRALTRLGAAIEPRVSAEDLSWLRLFDFFFLELLYYVTAIAEVKPDTPGKLTCPTCGTVFLPVREDWKRPR